jgi:hypothetical protein
MLAWGGANASRAECPVDARDEAVFEKVRLKPDPSGHGLPVPPLLPTVAVLGIALGLVMGVRLAPPPPTPTPAPLPSLTSDPSFEPTAVPSLVPTTLASIPDPTAVVYPPADGLTMQGVLAHLSGPGWWLKPTDVLSARVAQYNQVSSLRNNAPEVWVWVLVIKDDPAASTTPACVGSPSTPSACSVDSTQQLIVDYWTGDMMEIQSWSRATPVTAPAPGSSQPSDATPTL